MVRFLKAERTILNKFHILDRIKKKLTNTDA